jgi:hypothetical protein
MLDRCDHAATVLTAFLQSIKVENKEGKGVPPTTAAVASLEPIDEDDVQARRTRRSKDIDVPVATKGYEVTIPDDRDE